LLIKFEPTGKGLSFLAINKAIDEMLTSMVKTKESLNDPQKNGSDQFSNFMLPGSADSVPDSVVMNGDKLYGAATGLFAD